MAQRKKKVKREEQTLTALDTKSNIVEAAEVEVIKADADEPKLFEGKKMYWAKTMHFFKIGLIEGLILNRHWDIFLKTAPNDIDIYKWISSKDLKAEREARVKAKNKARLGLKD
jgi:hypothetical protein